MWCLGWGVVGCVSGWLCGIIGVKCVGWCCGYVCCCLDFFIVFLVIFVEGVGVGRMIVEVDVFVD